MAEAEPYLDVATHLRDELRRAWLRVEYQIRLGWTKAPAQPSLGAGDVVTPGDMGRLFATARGEVTAGDEGGAAAVLEQYLAVHRETEARIAATLRANVSSSLIDLLR